MPSTRRIFAAAAAPPLVQATRPRVSMRSLLRGRGSDQSWAGKAPRRQARWQAVYRLPILLSFLSIALPALAQSPFAWKDIGEGRMELREGGKPALVYNYGPQL